MLASTHPGQSLKSKRAELHARAKYISSLENTDLAHCAASLAKEGTVQRTVERRSEMLKALRKERGLEEEGKIQLHYNIGEHRTEMDVRERYLLKERRYYKPGQNN